MKTVVVGSGPAGVSVAKGLLERGFNVTMLDAGKTLEPQKQHLLNQIQLNQLSPVVPSLRTAVNNKKKLKLAYGSHFVYAEVKDNFSLKNNKTYMQTSFAKGGLSNVWGGVLRAYSSEELEDWPDTCKDLSSHYKKILSWLGNYHTQDSTPYLSQQALNLKTQWEQNQNFLQEKGFSFQTTELACYFKACQFCGSCQYGCPYGLIYNSAIHLEELKHHPHFTYLPGRILENVAETQHEVQLHIKDHPILKTERVFIACGAGISSMLYLRALGLPNKQITLKDSQHFVLPCLLDKPIPKVKQEKLHTLCQLNLTLNNEEISTYPIYLQLYTYMDLYERELQARLMFFYPFLRPLLQSSLDRLVVIQGYLDSKNSNEMSLRVAHNGEFFLKNQQVSTISSSLQHLKRYLKEHQSLLGFKPITWMLAKSLTGQSNHIGGSLPMRDNPQEDEVDIWGCPCHFKRVHFVDGSILPSIPAGPITLTIMANAYRIGSEFHDD